MPETADSSPEASARDLVAARNSHNIDPIRRLFHDDFEKCQAPLPAMQGLAAYCRHVEHRFAAYPDLRLEIVTRSPEAVAVYAESRATDTPVTRFFGDGADDESGGRDSRALDMLERRVLRERGHRQAWTGHGDALASAGLGSRYQMPCIRPVVGERYALGRLGAGSVVQRRSRGQARGALRRVGKSHVRGTGDAHLH